MISYKYFKSNIASLLWLMFFDHTSLNIIFPLLTLLFFDSHSRLFADLSATERNIWYGLCVALPHMINIIFTPLLSGLSDEFGRKKILLIATLGAVVFPIIAALGILWGMLSLLCVAMVIRGMFSRTNPIGQAIIGDISPLDKKVLHMGYLQAAISLGALFGPLIGGFFANRFFFNTLNFSLPFFIASIFAFISFIFTLCLFQETHIPIPETNSAPPQSLLNRLVKNRFSQGFAYIISHKRVQQISLILLFSQISWSSYYQFMPPILKTQLSFNADQLGIFVGLIALWLAIGSIFMIRYMQRFISIQRMLILSLSFVFIGILLTLFAIYYHLTLMIWLAAIPTAIGDVIAYSCLISLYSNAVEKEHQGKVMGVCFIVVALIWAMTGSLGGFLMSIYSILPLILAPLGILVGIGLLLKTMISNPNVKA